MKTFLFVLLFLLSGLGCLSSLLSLDLMGLGFWLLVAYVSHKFAFKK
jgi:hypothetical protein